MFTFFKLKQVKILWPNYMVLVHQLLFWVRCFKYFTGLVQILCLTVGLTTEAVIFFISAFEKPHADYDWSLVYPELADSDDDGNKSPVRELDNMLEKAKVDADLINV